jgi:hypothetical protein
MALSALAALVMAACTSAPSGAPSGSSTASVDPSAGAIASPEASGTPVATPAPTPTPAPTVPAGARLPNLIMEPLADWNVEYTEPDNRRLLHVTTLFSNVGDGPFELRGSRMDPEAPAMVLDQVIYTEGGGFRRIPTRVAARYAGDGHNHWHAQQVVTMELAPVLDPSSVTTGNKIHFCFFDNSPTHRDAPGARGEAYYQNRWCGKPNSYSVRMGLSVGWGDRYGWDFVGQYIDITNLAGGTYTLKATVDWSNNFYETDDTDNCTMSRIQIPSAGEGPIIVVEATDLPCPT